MERCTFRGRPVAEPDPASRFEEEAKESDVDCCACNTMCLEGTAVVLCGLVYDSECAMDEALRLRTDPVEWRELSDHDKAEALEIIETGAHVERAALTRRTVSLKDAVFEACRPAVAK